jgi:hypothetical protein
MRCPFGNVSVAEYVAASDMTDPVGTLMWIKGKRRKNCQWTFAQTFECWRIEVNYAGLIVRVAEQLIDRCQAAQSADEIGNTVGTKQVAHASTRSDNA